MKLKRLPLLIFGLIYGFVVQPIAYILALFYSHMRNEFDLLLVGGLLGGLAGLGLALGIGGPVLLAMAAWAGIFVILHALCIAVEPISRGIYIGLRGGWHCAMEFYDNGLIKGLTFPFRYFKAVVIDANRVAIANFHHTVIPALKKDTEEIVEAHTKTVISTLHNNLNVHLPSVVSNIVMQYALTPRDNNPIQLIHPMPKLLIRRITLWRENSINNTTIKLPGNTSEVFNSEETCIMIEWNLHSILFHKPKRNQYEEKETENRLTQACGRENRILSLS
ncbi:MAG: hypothetical protein K0R24_599 [Gammaproteobacteria bacterium]|jgi:hypothetical protein|nr:hypothetical protein [Gammaproteobacteria bacterium]